MGVVEDVIGLKDSIENDWDDISTTAEEIEKFLTDGLDWLLYEISPDKLTGLLKSLDGDLTEMLTKFNLTDFENDINKVESQIKSDVVPVFSFLKNTTDELNPKDAISAILNELPQIPLTGELPEIPSIPGISTNLFDSIMHALLDNDFSVALHDLPKHNQGGGGANQGTQNGNGQDKQEAEAIGGLGELLLKAFESEIEDKFKAYSSKLSAMKEELENLIEQSALADFQNELMDLEAKFSLSTLKQEAKNDELAGYLIKQLNAFVAKEESFMIGKIKTWFSSISTDETTLTTVVEHIGTLQSILADLTQLKADKESQLATLFKEMDPDAPDLSLLKVVSYLLAVPLTLSAKATGLDRFRFPETVFAFNNSDKAKINAAMMFVAVGLKWVDDGAKYGFNKKGVVVPWQYQVFMGLLNSSVGAMSQMVVRPAGDYFFSGLSVNNDLWNVHWFTKFAVSTLKWMLKSLWAYKHQDRSSLRSFIIQGDNFCNDFNNQLDSLKNTYNSLITNNQGHAAFSRAAPTLGSIFSNIGQLKTKLADFNSGQAQLKDCTQLVTNIGNDMAQNLSEDFSTLFSGIFSFKTGEPKPTSHAIQVANKYLNEFNGLRKKYNEQVKTFEKYKEFSDKLEKLEDDAPKNVETHDIVLELVFPFIEGANAIMSLIWRSVLWKDEPEGNGLLLFTDIMVELPEAIESVQDIIFFFSERKSKKLDFQKGNSATALAVSSQVFKVISGIVVLCNNKEKATIESVKYDKTSPQLTITFDKEVNQSKSDNYSFFTLDSSSDTDINSGTKANPQNVKSDGSNKEQYFWTLDNPLPANVYTLETAKEGFVLSAGDYVEASCQFKVFGIFNVSYDNKLKLTVTMVSGSKQVASSLNECFTIKSGVKFTTSQPSNDSNIYILTLQKPLTAGSDYTIQTQSGAFKDSDGNEVDSSFKYKVKSK